MKLKTNKRVVIFQDRIHFDSSSFFGWVFCFFEVSRGGKAYFCLISSLSTSLCSRLSSLSFFRLAASLLLLAFS